MAIPSKFATIKVEYGAGQKHLYSLSEDDITYFPDEATALADIQARIEEGVRMVALMEIKCLFARSTKAEKIIA